MIQKELMAKDKRRILITIYILGVWGVSIAQTNYPKNYFINPLDLSITLAGTFGEVRSNHFHTGLDIRTDSREGLVVHAAADGYISRINVSPYGYGNALYITHPNGFVTVYGHLSRYNDAIARYVKKKQYEMHRYALDLYLKAGDMPVKKGDTVAFSGSTGAAEGPHLHFEIRDEKTEDPLNPLLFGYTYADRIPPNIIGICIYPLNDSSNVNGKHTPLYLKAVKKESHYALVTDSAIKAYGKIGVGVRTYDMADGVESHNGPYTQVLTDDKDTVYYSQMSELSFSSIHYVNGHIDYEAFRKRTETIEHSFLQDNDRLDIYKKIKNRGRISFTNGQVQHLQYTISDFTGNASILPFDIHAEAHMGSIFHDTVKYASTVYWKKSFDYTYKGMSIHIPADITFQNIRFYCSDEETDMHTLCPIYHVQNTYTPLNSSYTLRLKPAAKLPDSLVRRAVMVQIDGKHLNSLGGVWDSGYMTAHPKTFGDFSLMLDLSRPTVKPLNIYKDKDMSKSSSIEFQISDNLSGIASYNAYVDDKWILMEFNPKKDMIYYTFDEHVTQGKHKLKLVVTDNVGNINIYQVDFTR
ncbi:MAG TPA: M23 family metallopeptidase [Bacteroidia bacterium]|jgi:hypothetical protein|nr:M23 family metallopeptidase [Bacteroidia bacterium]